MKKTSAGLMLCLLLSSPLAGGSQEVQSDEATSTAEAYYYFARAQALEAAGDWDGALEAYEQALELDPTNSSIYSEIASSYLRRGEAREAIDYAERAVRADRDNLEAHQLLSSIFTSMLTNNAGRDVSAQIVDRAIAEFEEVIRLAPTERQAYLMLGRLYRFKNEPDRAAQVYRDFLQVEPGSEEGAISLAELQMDAGNTAEAIEILKNFTEAQPDSSSAVTTLAEAYTRVEEFSLAADAFERAVELDGPNIDLLRALAQALFYSGRIDEAAERYEELARRDPEDALALLRLGQIYRDQMKFAEARTYMERAAAMMPDSVEIRFNLALLNRDEGRFEQALEVLDELLEETRRPNDRYNEDERRTRRIFLTHKALVNSLLERYDAAIAAFDEIKRGTTDRDGTVDAYIVDTYRTARRFDQALEHAERALEEFPDNRQLRIQRADLIAENGGVDEAVERLRDMTRDDAGDLQLYSAMVGIHQRAKDYPAAQDVLDEAMERFSDVDQIHFLQGALYERQAKYDEAERAFRRALEIDADNPAVLNYLGYMLADNETKLEEALTMIQTAVDADPINGAYLDSLGWVYYRLERLELAEQYLKRALLFAGNDPTVHEHLGDLYLRTGRVDEARAQYERSLELAEEDDEREKVREKLDRLKSGR